MCEQPAFKPLPEAYQKLVHRNSLIKLLKENKGSDDLKAIVEKENLNYMIISIYPEIYALYFMTATLTKPQHIVSYQITQNRELLKNLEAGLLETNLFKRIYNYDVEHFLDECMVVKFEKFTDSDSDKPESSIFKLVMPTNEGIKRPPDDKEQSCSSEDIEDEEMKNLIDTFNRYCCPEPSQNKFKRVKRDEPNSVKDSSTKNSSVEQMDSVLFDILSIANKSSFGQEVKEHEDESTSPRYSQTETWSTIESSTENSVDKMEDEIIFPESFEKTVPSTMQFDEEIVTSQLTSHNGDMPESYCRMFNKHKDFVSLRELMKLGDSSRVEKVKVSFSTQELFTTSNKYIAQAEFQKALRRARNETISKEKEQFFY